MLSRAVWGKTRSLTCAYWHKNELMLFLQKWCVHTERNSKPVQHFSRVRRSLEGIQSVFFSLSFTFEDGHQPCVCVSSLSFLPSSVKNCKHMVKTTNSFERIDRVLRAKERKCDSLSKNEQITHFTLC